MERLLKERERELKEESDFKLKEILVRHSAEINKFVEQIQKVQYENQSLEQVVKQFEQDKHSLEIKILEISEGTKNEKITLERSSEQLKKEKDTEV